MYSRAGTRAQAIATSKAASRCKSTRAAAFRTSGARAVPASSGAKLHSGTASTKLPRAAPTAATKAATRSKSMAAASVAPASTWLTTRALPNDLGEIHIVSSGLLESATPGNGGLRLWQYADKAAATKEAEGLAVAMSAKHKTYNTGFAGAKVVCAADKPVADWTAVAVCVEINISLRVRAESLRRPPRHRRDACSMAWRCRFLAARPSQDSRAIAAR